MSATSQGSRKRPADPSSIDELPAALADARPDQDANRLLEPLMTVPQLAELLQLTRKGVYALIEARRIPFVRVSNRVRFLRSDVIRWLRENRVPASEEIR